MPGNFPNWPYPNLIAHRGAGRHAPENTLAAIRLGALHGFTMMEFDVKLSRDEVPILLHDDTIDRTSNGSGAASQLSLKDLADRDFGAWHSAAYAGEPIATLYAVACYGLANGLHANIEIKPGAGQDAHTGRLVAGRASELWRHAGLPPLLSSFSEIALDAARAAAPDLPRALLIDGAVPNDWRARLDTLACQGIHIDQRHAHPDLIADILAAGRTLAVWTVNDPARAQELLQAGCHAVFTDEITRITPAAMRPPN
ncbi:MAG: glycerophosphodiester phosphodiesterase [Alcaligenaceae bacterium]|nr:glycerophosphodiester phosphodiesterase [Alcaligenaceae bacterium]